MAAGSKPGSKRMEMLEKWLTPRRLWVYPRAALCAAVIGFVGTIVLSRGLTTRQGEPLGGDYPVFYAVASLVRDGRSGDVFDVAAVQQAQADALGKDQLSGYHAWVYPPYTALLLVPLSLLPYLPSYVVFSLLMAAAVWAGVRLLGQVVPGIDAHRGTVFAAAVTFYPMLRAVCGGQNTALTFLLLCGSLVMLLRQRGVAGGIFLGLLMCKPHFGLPMIAYALLAGQRTAVLVSLGVTSLLAALATAVFGFSWPGQWLATVARYRELEGTINGPNLVSLVGVSERLLGPGLGSLVVAAVPSLLLVVWLCVRTWQADGARRDLAGSWAVATAVLILVAPHAQFYEVGLLALPGMLLADRRRMAAAPALLVLYLAGWSHAVLVEPWFQPLFLVALGGLAAALPLLRTPMDERLSPAAPRASSRTS